MNETAEVASSLPAILLLSFWWVFLSALEILSRAKEHEGAAVEAPQPKPGAGAAAKPGRFPELLDLDPTFNADTFLEGARRAYEAVLQAYAQGDLDALRPLLSSEVLEAFADALAGRSERRETLEFTLIGIETAEIEDVEIGQDTVEIAVAFRAYIVGAERSHTGEVIDGDPAAVQTTADLWTFSRALAAAEGGWMLVATDEAQGLA